MHLRSTVEHKLWRNSLVVSVLDLGSEGPQFEPVGRGWSRSKRGPVALCTLGLGLLNPLSLSGQ